MITPITNLKELEKAKRQSKKKFMHLGTEVDP